jgi:hypothetical protein
MCVDALVFGEGWNASVLTAGHFVSDHKAVLDQRIQDAAEIHSLVKREDIELDFVRAPFKASFAIGDRKEPDE